MKMAWMHKILGKSNLIRLGFFAILGVSSQAFAWTDPTEGEAFLPWLWQKQFAPVIETSVDREGLVILASGAGAALAAHPYDAQAFEHNRRGENLIMSNDTAGVLADLGSGVAGVGIAVTQLVFDQSNGLKHARAIALTSVTHITTAFLVQRPRPGGRGDYLPFASSFPSGHASSAFATAASLGYAYGWKAGVPAFFVASAIAASRVSENAHWLSDVVAGAALGLFWARASYKADEGEKSSTTVMPVLVPGGALMSLRLGF
jgi:hypothetical protein